QSWLVLQLSGSPLKLGLIGTFQFAPVLMFSVVAGAIVDRLPKRRLILATQSALALQAFTITALVWSGHVQYWHVAVLALLLGCANVIDMPTRQVFVVEMVGKDDLVNAIALNSAAFNGARIVGPAVAARPRSARSSSRASSPASRSWRSRPPPTSTPPSCTSSSSASSRLSSWQAATPRCSSPHPPRSAVA